MKIKLFEAREIQYFELGIFSVHYLTRGFIALTRAFNLPARTFNLVTRSFSLLTRGFELLTRRYELITRGFERVTPRFAIVTRNSCFTFPLARIASFDSSDLNLLTFRILEPYPFKDIELDLSPAISH